MHLGAERLALILPPWFDAELTELAATYFMTKDFQVTFCASAELPSDQRAIEPEHLYSWIRTRVPDDADASASAATDSAPLALSKRSRVSWSAPW